MWKLRVGALLITLALATHVTAAQTLSTYSVRLKRFIVEGSLSESERQKIIRDVEAQSFFARDTDAALAEIQMKVLCAFHDRGYMKAKISDATLLATSEKPNRLDVEIEVYDKGELYRLKQITFENAPVFTAQELRDLFVIRDGDVFSRKQIAEGFERLRRVYAAKGYINFTSVPDIKFDDNAKTISLSIDADAGAVFRVGKLVVDGEESVPGARKKLLSAWKPFEGQVCDPVGIMSEFLKRIGASPGVKPEEIFRTEQDQSSRIVTFRMTLAKPPE